MNTTKAASKMTRLLTIALAVLTLASCAKKNNWVTRRYHSLTTRYNVHFNGKESYKEGINLLYAGGKDDYTKVIPLYPISNHADTSLCLSQMNRAIEKATKAEKLHSIRVKPKKKPSKAKDPKYVQFMKKEEYNPQMGKVWLLHGKAQFHKGDFLGAVGTFTYVTKHFTQEPKRVTEANIWLARCYAEMDWLYDADDILTKLERAPLTNRQQSEFASAQADLALKRNEYKQAEELLRAAIGGERYKKQKTRDYYVLAQLSQKNKNDLDAKEYYKKAYRHSSNFDMTFNSKVGYAVSDWQNTEKAVKKLRRMAKNERYAEGLDKIYVAIAEIYMNAEQKDKAIENYKLAIEKSKLNGSDKVRALVSLGDLYYNDSEYILAQPLYTEAASLMPAEDDDYLRVSKRSLILGELAQHYDVVVTQDSVQRLARMSESERNLAIKAHIKKLQEQEEQARKKAEEEAKLASSQSSSAGAFGAVLTPAAGGKGWYFYNPQLVAAGKGEFQKKWGIRALEDNWRRTNKAVMSNDSDYGDEEDGELLTEEMSEDGNGEKSEIKSNVNTNVDYYISQLPLTPGQMEKSDEQIADALYAMGGIYEDKLEDLPMAIKTFEELERRFPRDRRLPDAYFMMFQMNLQKGDESAANWYRSQLVRKYPESSYAKVLKDPDYKRKMAMMVEMQDSLYQQAYYAYTRNSFDTVAANYATLKENFPLSPLMPKMLFVDALSKGKNGDNDGFEKGMQELVSEYPESDVSAMAKSMLALYQQGRRVQYGSTHGSILAMREAAAEELVENVDTLQFTIDRREPHNVMLITDNQLNQNALMFDVASYNFGGFIVKDFDITKEKFAPESNVLMVSSLGDMNEAFWYIANIEQDAALKRYVGTDSCKAVIISAHNLILLRHGRSFDDYLTYYNDSILPLRKAENIDLASAEAQRRSLVDAALAAEKLAKEADEKAEEARLERELLEAAAEELNSQNNKEQKKSKDKDAKNKAEAKKDEAAGKDKEETAKKDDGIIRVVPQEGKYTEDLLATHEYAILITGTGVDYDRLKSLIERYNSMYYGGARLQVKIYRFESKAVVTVEKFMNAYEAKNYMFGALRERQMFAPLQKVQYRNAIISTENKEELVRTADFDGYEKFNREHYLK